MMNCSTHSSEPAFAPCDRCGRFICRECAFPLKGPFDKTCLDCFQQRLTPEAQAARKSVRRWVTGLVLGGSVFVLPAAGMGVSVVSRGDDKVLGPVITGLIVAAAVIVIALAGWFKQETSGRAWFALAVFAGCSLAALSSMPFAAIGVGGLVLSGVSAWRVWGLRRFGAVFDSIRRLRELQVARAVIANVRRPL